MSTAAPVVSAAAPVVAAVGEAVPPVADAAVTLAGVLDPLLLPVADVREPLLGSGLVGTQRHPAIDSRGLHEAVQGSAASPAGAGRVLVPAGDDVSTHGRGGAAGVSGPVRPHIPGTGGPARVAGAGTSSFDQSPADLPTAVLATIPAAPAATGDARDAAGNVAFDPAFAPD